MKAFIAVPAITSKETIETMRDLLLKEGFIAVFAIDVIPYKKNSSEQLIENFNFVTKAMQDCDFLFADLTPFIGIEPDSDIIFQLGYMSAQSKPSFCYMNIAETFYERVRNWNNQNFYIDRSFDDSGNLTILERDRDNMRIENMGIKNKNIMVEVNNADNYNNLMLEGPSMVWGTKIVTLNDSASTCQNIYNNLASFRISLNEAKKFLKSQHKPELIIEEKRENKEAAYLAGPDVFLPDLDGHFKQKKLMLHNCNIQGVAPMDAQLNFAVMQSWALANGNNPKMRKAIYLADTNIMKSVRIGLFNLTPFHGATADSGTVFELGYMVGKDHKLQRPPLIFAYSNDNCNLNERIAKWNNQKITPNYGAFEAVSYKIYEKEVIYAPMVDGALLSSNSSLHHRLPESRAQSLQGSKKFSDLSTYEIMVSEVKRKLLLNKYKTDSKQDKIFCRL